MREPHFGCHTIRSHGVKLLWRHLYDWLVLAFLLVLIAILNSIHPFYRFISKEMMGDITYPHQSNTVPSWAVPVISIIFPIMVILPIYYFKKDVYDLHHAVLGVLFSVLLTGVITDVIKDAVGRPRPDFFWRCFPDGNESYDLVTGNVICHGEEHLIDDGHKSFPSGHTSWSFAGLGFLALYLSGKIRAFDPSGQVAKLCIFLLPLCVACLVGISRVDDYCDHWQDVFAGGILGWGTYAYFRALAESKASTDPANAVQLQPEAAISLHCPSPRYTRRAEDDLESGRVWRYLFVVFHVFLLIYFMYSSFPKKKKKEN